VVPLRKSFKYFRDHGCIFGIRHDRSLAVCVVDVSVPNWCVTGVDAGARLFGHSFYGFLAQVETVVARHQDLDAVYELLGRPGFAADDLILLDEMDFNAEFVYGCVIFDVSVEPVRLLH
jgi:hypothetical protein